MGVAIGGLILDTKGMDFHWGQEKHKEIAGRAKGQKRIVGGVGTVKLILKTFPRLSIQSSIHPQISISR